MFLVSCAQARERREGDVREVGVYDMEHEPRPGEEEEPGEGAPDPLLPLRLLRGVAGGGRVEDPPVDHRPEGEHPAEHEGQAVEALDPDPRVRPGGDGAIPGRLPEMLRAAACALGYDGARMIIMAATAAITISVFLIIAWRR